VFPGVEIPFADQTNWQLFAQGEIPIFQGAGRFARLSEAKIELNRLEVQEQATRLLIDQRVRSALYQAGASFLNIQFAGDAAKAARQNLNLVSDSYAEGVLGIIQLIDAQNQTLNADLAAANARFDYLLDLMEALRAVGDFSYFRSQTGNLEYYQRLNQYFLEKGIPINP
jgi:outer membrane protein TolC